MGEAGREDPAPRNKDWERQGAGEAGRETRIGRGRAPVQVHVEKLRVWHAPPVWRFHLMMGPCTGTRGKTESTRTCHEVAIPLNDGPRCGYTWKKWRYKEGSLSGSAKIKEI